MITALVAAALAAGGPIWVGRFNGPGAPPSPWRVVRLDDDVAPTRYQVTTTAGVTSVEARSKDSMAILARPISIDLAATPILCWRWYVDAPVANADMRKKSGDDYAARVYVAFDMPSSALSAGTRFKLGIARRLFGRDVPDAAVTYVWDNRNPVGTRRKSAYTDRAQMIVAETGAAGAGKWVEERADVAADFARGFEGKPGKPTRIAIATDTDNTNGSARAAFADLHFVPRGTPCQS
ncbi:DUF3047 domain-containing protein [Allosphingosinicella sp.]|uniref:DUF3047 domain-containing protein n=1 Tax=Allosphingosinicella sp. TaxID=2823234 RepID=UPI002FC0F388